jgi:hypothetical protein
MVMDDVWTFNMGGTSSTPNWTRLFPAPNIIPDNLQNGPGLDQSSTYPASRSRAATWRLNDIMYLFGGSQGTSFIAIHM